MSNLNFTPPKSKSNAFRKKCICDWGDKCCELTRFFDKEDHPLGGFVDIRYCKNSCNFLNAWHSICNILHVPKRTQDSLKSQYEQWAADPNAKKSGQPRIKIAKLHYPLEIVIRPKPASYLLPMTREEAENLGCYADREPPPHLDVLMKYDRSFGKGQTARSEKKSNGALLIRVAPTASKDSVYKLAASIQNEGASCRINMSQIREAHQNIQQETQLAQEREAANTRSPDEWTSIVSTEIAARDARISDLEAEVARL